MKTFAIIPAYNEEKTIKQVINETLKHAKNAIVVDDGSKDNTYAEAKKTKATVLKHLINLGKGAALKTGCDYAYMQKADTFVLIDADMQHKPEDIPKITEKLKGKDIIFCNRELNQRMPAILRIGNWGLEMITKILFNIKIRDTQCGFKAFTKEAYKKIRWKANDYSVESEIIAKTGKNKLKYEQVPIETVYNDEYKGTTPIDGIKIGIQMLKLKINGD